MFKVKVTAARNARVRPPGSDGNRLACILLFLGENCVRSPARHSFMPTYEYSCEKCAGTFEIVQSMRDTPLKECPKDLCRQKKWGHGRVKRLIGTGAGLIFKGSGFYITDYRSDSYREAAKKDAPSAPATADKSAAAKESTGAPPAAAKAKPEAKSKKAAE